ncbi:MAG TPA: CDP-alcohol phosphatidyltransferase family protein [Acidimicrobiales bacterium]|nr:CDP-alcohol phosphatidyltransferase family protein [Acidimicrobiales bacterium]
MIDGRRGRKNVQPEVDDQDPASVVVEDAPETLSEDVGAPDVSGEGGSEGTSGGGFIRMLNGISPRLVAHGVTADHVTVVGMLVAAVTGVMIGLGHLYLAVALVTFGGLMDTLDGAVAKAAGTSSKRGAFFDSVSDRIADMFVFGGLAWYFAVGPGHDPKLALLPFAILGVSNTISYERAKGELLGFEAKGGLMERAERLIIVGVALMVHIAMVPILWALLGLCVVTAGQRFFKVWRQATAATAATDDEALAVGGSGSVGARRPARVESRWRTWREASGAPDRRRRRVAVASRARSRRRELPLSIRLRQAFANERDGARTSTRTVARSGRARTERRRQGAESSFRRRLGSGR